MRFKDVASTCFEKNVNRKLKRAIMVQENEIVMLLLGIGVLIFMLGNRQKIKLIPESNVLIASFYTLIAGWVFTVVEEFIWQESFNILEHFCYAGSSVLMAVWCLKVFRNRGKTN
jgi:hypothetical protein